MIYFKNAQEFADGISRAIVDIEKQVDEVYRGLCLAAFTRIVEETPQWSGSAASNWNIKAGSPDLSVTLELKSTSMKNAITSGNYGEPLGWQKGDSTAVNMALTRNYDRLTGVGHSTPVFISNSVKDLSNEAYIMYLETDRNGFLRPENDPGHMVEYTVHILSSGQLTPNQVTELRNMKMGDSLGSWMT